MVPDFGVIFQVYVWPEWCHYFLWIARFEQGGLCTFKIWIQCYISIGVYLKFTEIINIKAYIPRILILRLSPTQCTIDTRNRVTNMANNQITWRFPIHRHAQGDMVYMVYTDIEFMVCTWFLSRWFLPLTPSCTLQVRGNSDVYVYTVTLFINLL